MSLLSRHNQLRRIAHSLREDIPLSDEDKDYLVPALAAIAEGSNPQARLDIKPKRGERKYLSQKRKRNRDSHVIAWVTAAMAPIEESGLGLTLDKAIEVMEKGNTALRVFRLAPGTVRNYYCNSPDRRELEFCLEN